MAVVNLIQLKATGATTYQLTPLNPEGFVADAIQTAGLPVIMKNATQPVVGDALLVDSVTTKKIVGKWGAPGPSGSFVTLQATTPGTPDTGNINVSGDILSSRIVASFVSTGSSASIEAVSATSGTAVLAQSTSGYSLYADSSSGIAVYGKAAGGGTAVYGDVAVGFAGKFWCTSKISGFPLLVVGGKGWGNRFEVQDQFGAAKTFVDYLYALTINAGLRIIGYTSSAADPTVTEYPNDKDVGIHKNTASTNVFLAYNASGVIKKVQLT